MVTYTASQSVRYGFIVTDAVVVVLRIAREYSGPGLAAGRPRRLARSGPPGGRSQTLDTSIRLSGPGGPSQASSEPYSDDDPLEWDYGVECQAIPWSNHGEQLTAKLALWALAMISLHGDSYIDYSYPGLDTWREAERAGIIHNISGATRTRATRANPPINCRIQQPNPGWGG